MSAMCYTFLQKVKRFFYKAVYNRFPQVSETNIFDMERYIPCKLIRIRGVRFMNKKLFTAIFALVIVFALLAFAGCTTDDGPDVTDPGNGTDMGETTDQNSKFTFSELRDGSYEVTGFSDDYDGAAEIVIPSEHNGKPVTAIGYEPFRCLSFCPSFHSLANGYKMTSVFIAMSKSYCPPCFIFCFYLSAEQK